MSSCPDSYRDSGSLLFIILYHNLNFICHSEERRISVCYYLSSIHFVILNLVQDLCLLLFTIYLLSFRRNLLFIDEVNFIGIKYFKSKLPPSILPSFGGAGGGFQFPLWGLGGFKKNCLYLFAQTQAASS